MEVPRRGSFLEADELCKIIKQRSKGLPKFSYIWDSEDIKLRKIGKNQIKYEYSQHILGFRGRFELGGFDLGYTGPIETIYINLSLIYLQILM